MEANRESAFELRRRSEEACRAGDLQQAVRLMERSVRLYPVCNSAVEILWQADA